MLCWLQFPSVPFFRVNTGEFNRIDNQLPSDIVSLSTGHLSIEPQISTRTLESQQKTSLCKSNFTVHKQLLCLARGNGQRFVELESAEPTRSCPFGFGLVHLVLGLLDCSSVVISQFCLFFYKLLLPAIPEIF